MNGHFRVGEWLVRPTQNRIAKGSEVVRVDPKTMGVLLLLAKRPGDVVTKEEFFESVWGGAIVTDEVLTTAVWDLRRKLGDDAKEPAYVQTVPREGYRLIAKVDRVDRTFTRRVWLLAIVALGTLGLFLSFSPDVTAPAPQVSRLTALAGQELDPAVAPDGARVAFSWDGDGPGTTHIYVSMAEEVKPLQLTFGRDSDVSPTWSSDGTRIAFLRRASEGFDIMVVSALGGHVRQLGATRAERAVSGHFSPGLTWSPDARYLAVPDRVPDADAPQIVLLEIETGAKRGLSSSPSRSANERDARPRFSPNGESLAFARGMLGSLTGNQILVQRLDEAEPSVIYESDGVVYDLDWSSNGAAIVFASDEGTERIGLFEVTLADEAVEKLRFGENAIHVSISLDGTRLVYAEHTPANSDIWRIPGPLATEPQPPQPIASSTRLEWLPSYSPDGSRIALASERSGQNAVWVCDRVGSNCTRWSAPGQAVEPVWSPAGDRLAYALDVDGTNWDVYVVQGADRRSRRVTSGEAMDVPVDWSPDGGFIYYLSTRSGIARLWKVSAEGGTAVAVTTDRAGMARASQDGRYLFVHDLVPWAAGEFSGNIWRVPVHGGASTLVLDRRVRWHRWTLWDDQIVFSAPDETGKLSILLYDLMRGTTRRLHELADGDIGFGLSVSPDGSWVVYSQAQSEAASDLILIEGPT